MIRIPITVAAFEAVAPRALRVRARAIHEIVSLQVQEEALRTIAVAGKGHKLTHEGGTDGLRGQGPLNTTDISAG
jgi:hypothetical protein